MGWKIVRDLNEDWSRAHGVSGEWRTCKTPLESLTKKLFEEAAEFAENYDAAELYDLRDVVDELIRLTDPDGETGKYGHGPKVSELGLFSRHIEWSPVPLGGGSGS